MLKVENLYKVFFPGSVNEKVALNHVSFELNQGDFVTIVGGNGAGKTTLLNCIAGVFPVEDGSVHLNGDDITRLPDYKRAQFICRIFQDPMQGTAGTLTVEENLALALRRGQKRRLRRAITERERKIFKEKLTVLQLGLENRLSTQVKLLSGGQRQALSMLMATLPQPKLALLDEHTASLDPKTGTRVLELTRTLFEEQGITTLMVTHNMEQALTMGNRTIMMHEGRIILDLKGAKRKDMTVPKLIELFYECSGEKMQQDRMLLI